MGYIVTSAKQGRLIRIQEEDINQFIVTEQIYMTSNGIHRLVNLQKPFGYFEENKIYTFLSTDQNSPILGSDGF